MKNSNHYKQNTFHSKNALKNYVIGILIMIVFLFGQSLLAQVGVGTTTPDASSALDVTSTDGGVLIPRMTQTDRDNITSPATGLLIYQTNNSSGFYFYNGTSWIAIISGNTDDNDWYEEGTTAAPNDINDNIFTHGRIAVGSNTTNSNYNITSSSISGNTTILLGNSNSTIPGAIINVEGAGADALQINLNGAQNGSDRYAIEANLTGSFSTKLGFLNGAPANIQNGLRNDITLNNSYYHDILYNNFTGSTNRDHNGLYNRYSANSLGRFIGVHNRVFSDGGGNKTGMYNYFTNNAGSYLIGHHMEVQGANTSSSYIAGLSVTIPSTVTAPDQYGVYSDVTRSSAYAGYFLGRVSIGTTDANKYILPSTRGLPGEVIQSTGTSGTAWVDPATFSSDDQNIQALNFSPSGNILTVGIENGSSDTVDLSVLDDADWYEENTTAESSDINDDIYTFGNVAIGKNTADYRLDIQETGAAIEHAFNITKTDNHNDETNGIYISKTGNGTGRSHGIFSYVIGNGNGNRYGAYNDVRGTGTGQKYGIFNRINSTAAGSQYGTRNWISGSSPNNQFGTFNNLANNGTADIYGVYNGMRVTNATNMYGVYNEFLTANTSSTLMAGVRNRFTNGTPGANGFAGIYTDFDLTANGTYYGVRNEYANGASGTGEKYGSYNVISSAAGGTHYGLYSSATKANSYSGYFLGRVSIGTNTTNNYILPVSRGTNGQVMTTNGSGIVSWQTPTTGDITAVTAGAGLTGGATGGTATITAAANNGLNVDAGADRIQWGGTLTEDTSINYGNFDTRFNLNNGGDFIIQDNGTGVFEVRDDGRTTIGRDMVWRDVNITGTIIAQMLDDGNDARFALYENGALSVDLDTNTQFIFNEQGFDRDFRIESDDVENMFRVDANNNRIGIGTATPDSTLHIESNSGGIAQLELTETNDDDDGARIRFNNSLETDNRWTLYGRADNTDSDSQFNLFYSGTSTNIMRIEGDGDVEFTGDLGINFNNPVFDLQLSANSAAKPGSNIWTVVSDKRLKQNIKSYSKGMDLINQLNPVSFNYNGKAQIRDTETHVGFIAQDIQKIAPHMVSEWANENGEKYLALDTNEVQYAVINALKKQQKQIQNLEIENNSLKQQLSKLEQLEARLVALEGKSNTNTSATASTTED